LFIQVFAYCHLADNVVPGTGLAGCAGYSVGVSAGFGAGFLLAAIYSFIFFLLS